MGCIQLILSVRWTEYLPVWIYIWLVDWNILYFPIQLGMSSSQLKNSYFSEGLYKTTNQIWDDMGCTWINPGLIKPRLFILGGTISIANYYCLGTTIINQPGLYMDKPRIPLVFFHRSFASCRFEHRRESRSPETPETEVPWMGQAQSMKASRRQFENI